MVGCRGLRGQGGKERVDVILNGEGMGWMVYCVGHDESGTLGIIPTACLGRNLYLHQDVTVLLYPACKVAVVAVGLAVASVTIAFIITSL